MRDVSIPRSAGAEPESSAQMPLLGREFTPGEADWMQSPLQPVYNGLSAVLTRQMVE
jgi:hypothetical protein